jgi:hypothetical protein
LERYKEFIINSLDLISFLLVTPELINLVNPAIGRVYRVALYVVVGTIGQIIIFMITLLVVSVFGIIWIFLAALFGYDISAENLFASLSIYPFVFTSFIPTTLIMMKVGLIEFALTIRDRTPKHLFSVGVILFLTSRVFSFIMAAQELMNSTRRRIPMHDFGPFHIIPISRCFFTPHEPGRISSVM